MTYSRFIRLSMRSVCTLIVSGSVIIGLCVLLDWFGHAGWGYPWWSMLFLIGIATVALVVRHWLVASLKQIPN